MPGNYNCYECKKTELEKAKSEFDQCLEKIREERNPVRIREDRPIQIQKNRTKHLQVCLISRTANLSWKGLSGSCKGPYNLKNKGCTDLSS